MKFRVYLKRNESKGNLFPTYFKTLREAKAYASQFADSVIQKKIATSWYGY